MEALTRLCAGRCRLCGYRWIARDPVAAAREHLACVHAERIEDYRDFMGRLPGEVSYVPPQPRVESIWIGAR